MRECPGDSGLCLDFIIVSGLSVLHISYLAFSAGIDAKS